MFRKLHIQLTVICTLITGIIMIVMTCFCLYISEDGLTTNEYGTFLTSINAIYSHLESDINITTEWLAQTENNGKITVYIEDNGIPIKNVNQTSNNTIIKLIKEAKTIAAHDYKIDISDSLTSKIVTKQIDFKFRDHENEEYYASAAYIPKKGGGLGVLAIYSLEQYRNVILSQRLLFGGIIIAAIIILGLFSYFFTQRVLRPIEKNRKKQVEFIASASHELRSPLTVITSSISAMKKADSIKAERFEEIIASEIKRMSRLINDMLSLASVDNHSWTINLENIDLDLLLLNTYEAFQPLATMKGINLNIDLPDDVLTNCKCDKQRLEQVLTILIDNALSYTEMGGSVTLTFRQKPHNLEIHVIDTGIGISDTDKEHIFDRFYRVDSAHKSKEHFGLGLCIAYEIIKLHKGLLTVSETPGGGTTFVITLNI
ncbi:MAG TPA: HAMP domain-containing sensor histidine kinase [Ruminiclostridium sp.]